MRFRSHVGCRWVTLAAGAALLGAGNVDAAAAPPPPANPAVAQYIEQIPTASGGHAAGAGHATASVPAATRRAIKERAGQSAPLLEDVVSSEAYGAPLRFGRKRSPARPQARTRTARPSATERPTATRRRGEPALDDATRAALPPPPSAASAGLGTLGGGGSLLALTLGAVLLVTLLLRIARP